MTSLTHPKAEALPLPISTHPPTMNEKLQNRGENGCVQVTPARLIVWESDGSWARHLRRELAPDGPRVHETRTPGACGQMVVESPASLVVAHWTSSTAAELVEFVTRFARDFPGTRTVAVASRNVESLRWRVLEAGIVWCCSSPRRLGPVVEIIRRHFERVPRPVLTTEERVWDELPWPRAAGTRPVGQT
jgi:hypothetical protein